MASLQTKLKKVDPVIMKVFSDFCDIEPGESLVIGLVWGSSIQSLYQKIYRTHKLFEACANDSVLSKASVVRRVLESFNGYSTNQTHNTLELKKALKADKVITAVLGSIEKSAMQLELEAETERLEEEMAEELAEINEDFIRDDEEMIDKGLPPSAGDTWLEDDEDDEDDEGEEGDPDILKFL